MTSVDESAARIVADLAQATQDPTHLEPGGIYAWLTPAGQVQKIDLTGDEYLDFPQRKRGIVTVRNVASFARYYAKHADEDSEVFADLDKGTVTAVLDAHRGRDEDGDGLAAGEGARWQQHRLVLTLQPTLPWAEWTGNDRRMMSQQAFAEFLEEHARDIDPQGAVKAADLLEVSQDFRAHMKIAVKSGKRLQSGQTQFEYTEEITASGGSPDRGTLEMPNEFDLLIAPYDDIAPAVMAVRLRYRIQADRTLSLGYFMNDPARVAREAVAEVVAKLEAECSVTVMHGQPA